MTGTRHVARGAFVPLASALVLVLTACSGGGGREYTIPKQFCGTKIPKEAIEPLLPDGKELKQSPPRDLSDGNDTVITCAVSIDGSAMLSLRRTELDKPLTDGDKRVSRKTLHDSRSVHLPDVHWAVQGDDELHLSTPCKSSRADSRSYLFDFRDGKEQSSSPRLSRKDILRFAKAFVPRDKKKGGCTR
ncbi:MULTISPECIES: hypothetical protein [unclassified Streptomyces]|uniref:hypothetical protein n=1 Tax=unclassified Streptomyces TaxID=2593676 RepID=UPI002DDAB433|nr:MULTISPECIES: hypothetical protein [unclassified Streptomyces]WSB80372.1 hypothetical protein OHB04_34785 [Streptomyces sp. NBC_01775]WSS11423.1 hypothetical protein OG533_05480 [Streptomyces sp. NBC_01186]WSS40130.1 hypothetical protein OG220_05575 [Streptomyces sp. NBC_01187]